MEELTLKSFEEAAEKVKEATLPTNLVYSEYFSSQTGNRVYLKPENMQYTGAYKVRGAYYKISTMSEEARQKGLITASAGNHAQGVAFAAKKYGVKATVVMPTTTPLIKVNRTKGYGAEVILYGNVYDEACEYAMKLAKEKGLTFVHPFDDLDVATGQGSIAMEIIKELPTVDYILVPIGGGGLATGVSTLRILDAIRESGVKTKFYQASTSELFGGLPDTAPQSEKTPFYPKSPYGVAKLYSYWITVNYRESYDIFACNGILFNHESPRRGETFVTRKITRAAAAIHLGMQDKLYLGNLDAKRDWGHAKDYVEGMWRILQQDKPQDYVLSMNETHTVREFVELAFAELGYELEWQGTGVDEKGIDKKSGRVLVEVDPRYFRPAEVELLWGDSTKARTELGWEPKYSFMDLVKEMVQSDLEELKNGGGYKSKFEN